MTYLIIETFLECKLIPCINSIEINRAIENLDNDNEYNVTKL